MSARCDTSKMKRRILRLSENGLTVATEQRFESEARLHEAIAAHPEVLPAEDWVSAR